ncbi:hypothetical protein Bca52824_037890 [Brassica carinata]|uniref:Uncharacterized protein n=1 Tax=Brassica carinata TaxID=52824 RepID=A0A8X7RMX2_BRACI|nr:hypothetical protein Bca52824_037890 [Brassica carinata]
MKKLVSLPPLPDSLLELDADNCKSLKRLDCSFRNPVIRLNFRNCFKLNQEARDLIIQTRTNEYSVFPGEEVPKCFFTYRSSGSESKASCITSGGNALTACYKRVEQLFRGHLYTFEVEVETEEVTSTELVFDFEVVYQHFEVDITECGVFQLM